ncbi:hypothetical protein N5C96_23465 [Delftia tsuruhatensis]|uniref:hypothetical protein n=1 Tax=Delftia tsuruhatensis TaxID=180282 RepID=UPI002444CADC|nr:hypothetical protein [Delftia tsuruhatensis]MDH0776373.1 hypothetical protein [Delftia tsuruhatensis]MDH1460072.1 hypothetical protein [Delftia tsuruhatensis]MDH1823035.1 hypothetical protein [Delftia tsuruhatensis]WGG12241.1 hypothetical protein N5O86_06255 [Delftia tsuruhatensis]
MTNTEKQTEALRLAVLLEQGRWLPAGNGNPIDEAAAELRRLDAENKALRADAERYHWLREQNWHDSDLCAVRRPRQAVKPGYDCPSGNRLDAFCDAGIAAQATAKDGGAA